MHLGKIAKFNMILAILICMAFVVNLGSTFAIAQYSFKAKSISAIQNEIVQNNVYTDYGYAQGSQGKYIYSPGVYSNQLSINYGFRQDYDLIIRFSATYTNPDHSATDFSLNFANRDKWLVDMGSVSGLKVDDGGQTVVDESQTYYNLTSSSNTITGVMYYMGQISGSGTMPIISGVNFYTSPNNSYNYIGDTLTITLTPEYVKSNEYNDEHSFNTDKNGFTPDENIFSNWISYMSGSINTAESGECMIYNAYVYDTKNDNDKSNDRDMSLKYPVDESLIDTSTGLVKPNAGSPMYTNTAYRYTLVEGGRNYEALTAGNKYYGGLGVYVIPNADLITIGVTVSYVWQKDGEIAGFSPSGVVTIQTSSDITTITKDGTNYNYYKSQISSPTYINVLEYIMLTAENYEIILKGGYSLILNYINVSMEIDDTQIAVGDDGKTWSSQEKECYTINNSTNTSPVLARATNITMTGMFYDTDISITNNSDSVLKITSFSVKGYLWYGAYTTTNEDNGNGGTDIVEHFVETPLGGADKCYLRPTYEKDQGLTESELDSNSIWKYNTDLWTVTYSNNTYTFSNNSGVAYIPSGYTMTLISGVTIPQTIICQDETTSNDFWCSIELVDINAEQSTPTYATSTSGVETIVEGYYSQISPQTPGKIYVRNNTNQEITKLTLSNLYVYEVDSGYGSARDRVNMTDCSYIIKNHLNLDNETSRESQSISIKPNEIVLAYTITPSYNSVIYNYKVTATLKNSEYDSDIKLAYNAETNKGDIVNNSSKFYEFRLISSSQLTNFVNSQDFVEKQVGTTYYYYYVGIICPNQCVTIFNGDFACNVIADKIEHDDAWDISHYISSNYEVWGLSENDDWLKAMNSLFGELTVNERQNAVKVN